MASLPRFVQDENKRRYNLVRSLAEGGEGEVFLEEHGKYLIKILKRGRNHEHLRRQIARVQRLPLDGLPMSQPVALLNLPDVGYVMDYVTGMIPLHSLLCDGIDQYIETGGIKRRLEILLRIAEVLNVLHGKGLAYGDISPNNILISEKASRNEIYFIDLDNLSYEVSTSIYTRRYGAPEIVSGKQGNDSLSDAYSLAVIIFQILTQAHPLLGNIVLNGPPELEQQALAGNLAWIMNADDQRNRSDYGLLPRESFILPKLLELCHRVFGPGLLDRSKRPRISEWIGPLNRSLQSVLECECGFNYYIKDTACPHCGQARPDFTIARIRRQTIRDQEDWQTMTWVVLPTSGSVILTRRQLGFAEGDGDRKTIDINLKAQKAEVRSVDTEAEIWITKNTWKLGEGFSDRRMVLDRWVGFKPEQECIHFGSPDMAHPVLTIRTYKNEGGHATQ